MRGAGHNDAGYRLGNLVEGSSWLGWHFTPALSTTLRLKCWQQGEVQGAFVLPVPDKTMSGSDYYPANYGGHFVDLGIGMSVRLGAAASHDRLALEWLQPMASDYHGVQAQRLGTLNLKLDLAL